MHLILASQSQYKKEVLAKLGIPFDTITPDIDETALAEESPEQLVVRLAKEKALKVEKSLTTSKENGDTYIIGVDQVACFDGKILGKAGTLENARQQLGSFSGQTVEFLTGICLMKSRASALTHIEPYSVKFKTLTEQQIKRYVGAEHPTDCAGSFKCEGAGILLFDSMHGRDINSLIGLPLIALNELFAQFGVNLLEHLAENSDIYGSSSE